jgi:hypothetical protein
LQQSINLKQWIEKQMMKNVEKLNQCFMHNLKKKEELDDIGNN